MTKPYIEIHALPFGFIIWPYHVPGILQTTTLSKQDYFQQWGMCCIVPSLEIQSKLAVSECFIYFIHLRPVLPSGIGVDSLHLSFLFCIKKHNANRRQNWLFISAPSEVVTGIITEEKLQGLFQWHFSCCSREDKRLKVSLTYLQSKDASVHCSDYFQVD